MAAGACGSWAPRPAPRVNPRCSPAFFFLLSASRLPPATRSRRGSPLLLPAQLPPAPGAEPRSPRGARGRCRGREEQRPGSGQPGGAAAGGGALSGEWPPPLKATGSGTLGSSSSSRRGGDRGGAAPALGRGSAGAGTQLAATAGCRRNGGCCRRARRGVCACPQAWADKQCRRGCGVTAASRQPPDAYIPNQTPAVTPSCITCLTPQDGKAGARQHFHYYCYGGAGGCYCSARRAKAICKAASLLFLSSCCLGPVLC